MSINIGFVYPVAFCVWVLKVDGLQVPPFDRHQDGDHTLRELGLDSGGWKGWVSSISARVQDRAKQEAQWEAEHAERWHTMGQRALQVRRLEVAKLIFNTFREDWITHGQEARELSDRFPLDPPQLWLGESTVRVRLTELWEAYQARKHLARHGYKLAQFMMTDEYAAFAQDMASQPGPRRFVFIVNYPWPAIYAVSQTAVLLGTRGLETTVPALHEAVLQAVELAQATGT